MNLFGMLDVSASALEAERERAEVVASNLANAETTHSAEGGPYQRREVVFAAKTPAAERFSHALSEAADAVVRGVRVERVLTDPTPPLRRYQPSHQDADADGYVSYPAINPIEEIVDLMGAARAYQLNVAAVQTTKAMILQSLQIVS
jgi:flagellar basal-body rod protein FlgC